MIRNYFERSCCGGNVCPVFLAMLMAAVIPVGVLYGESHMSNFHIQHVLTTVKNTSITATDNCATGVICFRGAIKMEACPHEYPVGKMWTRADMAEYLSAKYPIGSKINLWVHGDDCRLEPDSSYPAYIKAMWALLGMALTAIFIMAVEFLDMWKRGDLESGQAAAVSV